MRLPSMATALVTTVLAACSQPASPSRMPNLPAVAEPAAPVTAAVLTFSRVSATVVPSSDGAYRFVYRVAFVLTETGGRSGATIQNVEIAVDDRFNTGPGCWRDPLRVPPGGTLDVFANNLQWLGYCAPAGASRVEATRLLLTVTFTDDEGREGRASTAVPVTR